MQLYSSLSDVQANGKTQGCVCKIDNPESKLYKWVAHARIQTVEIYPLILEP